MIGMSNLIGDLMEAVQHSSLERAMEIIHEIDFPTLPLYLQMIQKELLKKDPSFPKITNLISQDIALTAKILKTVNSPAYSTRYKIDSISQALTTLGLTKFYTAVLEQSIKNALNQHHLSSANFAIIWKHSSEIATVTQLLAKEISDNSELDVSIDLNFAYLVGLFHDCGIPVMAARYTNYEKETIKNYNNAMSLVDSESQEYLTDHSVVCYLVAKMWDLPEPVQNAIFCHHSLDLGYYKTDQEKQLALILRLAELFVGEINQSNNENAHPFTDDKLPFDDILHICEVEFGIDQDIAEELYAEVEELISK